MSILMLQPVFKDAIWGGKLLKNFGYEEAGDNAGECWGISAHQNGDCTVANGEFAGKKLSWCYENHRELFGNIKEDVFPLLIKIGIIVICFGEISGGRRNPFSSP